MACKTKNQYYFNSQESVNPNVAKGKIFMHRQGKP